MRISSLYNTWFIDIDEVSLAMISGWIFEISDLFPNLMIYRFCWSVKNNFMVSNKFIGFWQQISINRLSSAIKFYVSNLLFSDAFLSNTLHEL